MGKVKSGQPKKTRRGKGRRKKNESKSNKFTIIGTNADGLMSKKESFANLIENNKPSCFMIQETKVKSTGQIKVKGYQVFESVRKDRDGGGLMIGIDNEMQCEPVLVSVGDEEVEIMVVEIDIKIMKIRLITAYGPQENAPDETVKNFYSRLEEEIDESENCNCETIIEFDCNAKLGKNIIKNDPKEMSENGKLLWDIVKRRNLVVGNASDKCKGVITRSRGKATGLEASVIDYIIVSENISRFIDKMEIDEDQTEVLTKFSTRKGVKEIIKSDHNILKCDFTFSVQKRVKTRTEVYTLRDSENLKEFKLNTNNAKELIESLENEKDAKIQGNKFMKFIKNKIHESFKKVRVGRVKKSIKKSELDMKLDKRTTLRKQIINEKTSSIKHELEDALDDLETEIAAECAQKHNEMITDNIKELTEIDGTFNNNKMWKLKRKIINKRSEPLCAKKDSSGHIISNPEMIKKLYLDTYVDRLRHKEIKPELQYLKKLREELFALRLESCKLNKSMPWEMSHLDKVLSKLKPNKAIDPTGLANELFRLENIGHDLKKALLILLNNIKETGVEPDFMSMENIVSLYKGKGARNELDNDRGIFILNVIRNIRDRLIFNDINSYVEENMSDSQVGAQRDKGIRNHLFVLYSIMNSVKQKESLPIDIQIYDVKKCFDSLWLLECCNNLYDSQVKDDKLAMIYESNRVHKIAVKTPTGLTERITVDDVIAQGSVIGPTCAAVQVDLIGKVSMNDNEVIKNNNMEDKNNKIAINSNNHQYIYKGEVGIPPLSMIDDVANVAECGLESLMDNAYIVAKFEQLKLELNQDKCHKMHVGRSNVHCPTLKAHNKDMNIVLDDKYLGDIVSSDAKHTKNIKSRSSKCIGVITDIFNMLKLLCLGQYFFRVSVILRQALFLSVMLLNAETWLRLSESDVRQLESTDEMLLRKFLDAPSKTPIPALYLELGCLPVRFVIKAKRIMFLHYLLKRDKQEMISKVFWAQCKKPVKGDWCLVVLEDLDSLGLGHLTLTDIGNRSKSQMKKLVKEATKTTALKYLLTKKETLSKMKPLQYSDLRLQPYLTCNSINLRLKRLLFKLRTRMISVGYNFGQKKICQVCRLPDTEDRQEHVLLECVKTRIDVESIEINQLSSVYNVIYSDSIEKTSDYVRKFDLALRRRVVQLENT